MSLRLTRRMVEVTGLAWKGHIVARPKRTGTYPDGRTFTQKAIEFDADVFIPTDALWAVSERTTDDYIMGNPAPQIGYHEQHVLVHLGLAEEETRGGIHGTVALRVLLERGADPAAPATSLVVAARADALLDAAAWIRNDSGLHTGAGIAEWLESRARKPESA